MQIVKGAANSTLWQRARTGFDRVWDWTIYQWYRSLTWIGKKVKRPYELAKLVVFWMLVVSVGLGVLYLLSLATYLTFYFVVLRPPAVPVLLQPLNLRYPDPGTADYIYAYHCLAPVTYPQTYNWKLSLELPENPSNFDAGVFMVSLALYPPDELPTQPHEQVRDMFYRHLQGNVGNPSVELEPLGEKLRIGSRPLMLRFRPDIYRWFHTAVFAIPRLISEIIGLHWFEETQRVEVNMIERHLTNKNATYTSKQCFVVSINNPKVQIYKATVEATVLLEGWRYVLYTWFWTCFALGSFFIFITVATLIFWYFLIRLIAAVIRGEVQFPKLWLTDEEQQMKDMKDAVNSLMYQKRQEAKSRQKIDDSTRFPPSHEPNWEEQPVQWREAQGTQFYDLTSTPDTFDHSTDSTGPSSDGSSKGGKKKSSQTRHKATSSALTDDWPSWAGSSIASSSNDPGTDNSMGSPGRHGRRSRDPSNADSIFMSDSGPYDRSSSGSRAPPDYPTRHQHDELDERRNRFDRDGKDEHKISSGAPSIPSRSIRGSSPEPEPTHRTTMFAHLAAPESTTENQTSESISAIEDALHDLELPPGAPSSDQPIADIKDPSIPPEEDDASSSSSGDPIGMFDA